MQPFDGAIHHAVKSNSKALQLPFWLATGNAAEAKNETYEKDTLVFNFNNTK